MSQTAISPTDRSLPWAVYLGMSWTWCIGMFLPVLLVRDLGISGWLVFAAPNVIGAAAMGFVLQTRTESRRMVLAHVRWLRLFSWVTIAFHIFFIKWLLGFRMDLPWGIWVMLFAAMVFAWIMVRFPAGELAVSAIALLVSVGAVGFILFKAGSLAVPTVRPAGGAPAVLGSLSLLPVCIIGFGLCPYLDLTFQRARQHLNHRAAKIAFAAGFGIFFLGMILFSLRYAPHLAAVLGPGGVALPRPIAAAIGIHLVAQAAVTVLFHFRGLWRTQKKRPRGNWPVLAVVLIPMLLAEVCAGRWEIYHLDCGEAVYRAFMGFYGLVFPAYVAGCMLPFERAQRPTLRRIGVVALTVVAALPFYFAGFMLNRFAWLLPGAAIVILAGLLLRMGARSAVAGGQGS